MIPRRLQLALWVFGRHRRVSLDRCVHYGAFRYGRGEDHPYETFVRLLETENGPARARRWLVEFLQYYRPESLAAALGVELSAAHALWSYPWARTQSTEGGWKRDPLSIPDIVTHYCADGVPWFRIEQEFYWLENAYRSISLHGFRPELGPTIVAQRFVAASGEEAFLIRDGNHRISALAALGYKDVIVTYLPMSTVHEAGIASWPQVKNGRFSIADARAVFGAYFSGNSRWRLATVPAPLLWSPDSRGPTGVDQESVPGAKQLRS